MSRPRGSIRQALAASALELASQSPMGGTSWREAAAHARVGFKAAFRTWHNMRRSGELLDVGTLSADAGRPLVLCAPAGAAPAPDPLGAAVRSWSTL